MPLPPARGDWRVVKHPDGQMQSEGRDRTSAAKRNRNAHLEQVHVPAQPPIRFDVGFDEGRFDYARRRTAPGPRCLRLGTHDVSGCV